MRLLIWQCIAAYVLFVSSGMSAELAGRVEDVTGGVIRNAKIHIRQAGAVHRTATTDAEGRFLVKDLAPRTYSLTCDHPGFESVEVRPVLVVDGSSKAIHIVLRPGRVIDRIEVIGNTVPADPVLPALNGVVHGVHLDR